MRIDDLLTESASTVGALGLLVIALLGILFMKRRKVVPLGPAVAALLVFLALHLGERLLHEESPVAAHALGVIALIAFAFAAVRVLAFLLVDLFLQRRTGQESPRIIRDIVVAGLYLVAAAWLLKVILKVDVAALLTTAGILSIVVGLSLQETLGNLFSGLALQMERTYVPGDWISFGEAGSQTTGKVVELGWRATTLLTRADDLVIVPNSVITKVEIVNHSRPARVHGRVHEVSLAYATPPSVASEVILKAVAAVAGVLSRPEPTVRVKGFGDSGVLYVIAYSISDFADALKIEAAVNSTLWYALRRAGLEVPFPIRRIFTSSADGHVATLSDQLKADAEGLLKEVDFLAPLDAAARARLASLMRPLQYGAGETIVRQGEEGETFFLIDNGEVAVQLTASDGTERAVTALRRGQFFGEMSLLSGEPRTATVVATRDSLLLSLDRQAFREVLLGHPEIAQKLSELLGARGQELIAAAVVGPAVRRDSRRILGRLKELFRL